MLVVVFNIVERKKLFFLLFIKINISYSFRLKYLGSEKYEIQGFTTVDKAKSQDIAHLLIPNSGKIKDELCFKKGNFKLGGQPALNLFNANYIFKQIAKCFCLMFSYEEIERSTQNESKLQNTIFLNKINFF